MLTPPKKKLKKGERRAWPNPDDAEVNRRSVREMSETDRPVAASRQLASCNSHSFALSCSAILLALSSPCNGPHARLSPAVRVRTRLCWPTLAETRSSRVVGWGRCCGSSPDRSQKTPRSLLRPKKERMEPSRKREKGGAIGNPSETLPRRKRRSSKPQKTLVPSTPHQSSAMYTSCSSCSSCPSSLFLFAAFLPAFAFAFAPFMSTGAVVRRCLTCVGTSRRTGAVDGRGTGFETCGTSQGARRGLTCCRTR